MVRFPGMRKKKPEIPRTVWPDLRPIRAPGLRWDKNESGEVVIELRLRPTRLSSIASKFADIPKTKKAALDKIGSYVWEMCDGKLTVQQMTRRLARKFKLTVEEADVSLLEFLNTLSKRGIIVYAVPKEMIEDQSTGRSKQLRKS